MLNHGAYSIILKIYPTQTFYQQTLNFFYLMT